MTTGVPVHALPVEEVYAALGSSPAGLGAAEARERLARHGPNAIRTLRGKPLWRKLLANFTHLMALLLWAGGALAFVGGMPQLGWAIWAVVVINAVFSFWQEFKAEKATEALRRLLPVSATRGPRRARAEGPGRRAGARATCWCSPRGTASARTPGSSRRRSCA